MAYDVEITDTFGGDANYSWVRRYVVEGSIDKPSTLIRRAKRAAGWSGLRCRVSNMGDLIELRPYRACWVMFITWRDVADDGEG